MSSHDPIARRISFERFLSRARAKPPDIDIDFRHDRRDELMQYVRDTYGRDRVANVSNYVTYRAKSLLRDLDKALGFDTADMDRLREMLGWSRGDGLAEEIVRTPELRALNIPLDQYADLFALCAQLSGLPRHLGTHSSGIVISDVPLCEVAPLYWAAKGVETVALDKEDVEAEGIGLLKMDQLALRALTAIDIAVGDLTAEDPTFDYEGRDREDKETLAMIRAAQTVTAFQLESPAQMALQWRLRPTQFDDLVASVALIRPGPILGGSVDTYVRRRLGWEKVTYPVPELEPILKDTYGRIIFQDQVLDVVRVVGGLTERQADAFRRALTHARSEDEMTRLGGETLRTGQGEGTVRQSIRDGVASVQRVREVRLSARPRAGVCRSRAGDQLAAAASSGGVPGGHLVRGAVRLLADLYRGGGSAAAGSGGEGALRQPFRSASVASGTAGRGQGDPLFAGLCAGDQRRGKSHCSGARSTRAIHEPRGLLSPVLISGP